MSNDRIRSISAGNNAATPDQADITSEIPQAEPKPSKTETTPVSWPAFIKNTADSEAIKDRFAKEINELFTTSGLAEKYCLLLILDPETSIGSFDLDQVYKALQSINADRGKDVLLILLSPGGSIEPAYQISKLCKAFSKKRFIVSIPRKAKSAATLIAIGADEIHMGPLGQLGPIDPQLDGLPALGVSQALNSLASLSEQYPKSADMFSRYLHKTLTIEQIGYCERISESAVQYAERLLSTKKSLPRSPGAIARELVHEYKDHGFVIDIDEARQHLGDTWVLTGTDENAIGGIKGARLNFLRCWTLRGFANPPRSARRVPQPHREQLSETVFEPEARFLAPGELVERPVGRGTEEVFARSGRAFSW